MLERLRRHGSIAATAAVLLALLLVAGLRYEGFLSARVLLGLLSDHAFLGIAAIGVTFVILSGGIDLSVGAMVGCASIVIATLIEVAGVPPPIAIALVLAGGAAFGAAMGGLIHAFRLPPFIVTLAGMFLARGLGFVVHQESIAIRAPFFRAAHALPERGFAALGLGPEAAATAGRLLPTTALLFLLVLGAGVVLARHSRFGRAVYAIGGNAESARLLGLPVASVTVRVYALSGLCSALAGATYALYTFSGNPTAGTMLELDAIAAAVIGGTLLAGGVGSVGGTLLGVLIFGVIQTAIAFDGRLSSWWTRIAIGGLLLVFILIQRALQRGLQRAVGPAGA